MSEFEFVLISFAIVIGLGVSEVLSGWADQIRHRHRLRIYPLQIAASAFVLYFSLQYLWLSWIGRDVDWTFPRYLGVASPALVLALAARVSRVDTSVDAPPIREQYFRSSPAIYSLLALFPLLITIYSLVTDVRDSVLNPPNLLAVTTARILVLLLYGSLAWSKSERYHWFGLVLLWITAIGFMIRLGSRLAESGA